jgi:hypothetical protein
MRLVAIAILSTAITSAAGAGPNEAEPFAQRCVAPPASVYQAIIRLGGQFGGLITPAHPPMTLTPGQARSLQIRDTMD